MANALKRIGSWCRAVMPNAAWDAIKNIVQFAYQNWALVLVIIGFIGSALTALINRLRGIPSDAVGILVVFGIVIIVALLGYAVGRVRDRKRTAATPNESGESTDEPGASAPQAKGAPLETDIHAECKKRIGRLLDSEHTHALRADSAEARLEQFKAEYALPVEIANNQLTRIGEFIEVVRACTHDVKLDDDLPTIRWGLRILNHSVFRIQLDGKVGPLFFEGRKLTQPKELVENTTLGLSPYREGSLIFEQQLSQPECELFKRRPDGLFQFDQVLLHFKGYKDERVKSGRLIIPSEFRARLGRCGDLKTQSTEPLEAQIDELRLKLSEASSIPDNQKASERKRLLESWRSGVFKAAREYRTGEAGSLSFPTVLEFQEGYLTMIPYLSQQAKTALQVARLNPNADISRLLETMANEIARIEEEWGL